MISFSEVFAYLERRGTPYGIELNDILSKTPQSIIDKPDKIIEFWKQKDISHRLPISTHPELQNDPDNWFPEDISENRSRNQRGEIPSEREITDAYLDNEMDVIDQDYDDDGIIDTDIEIDP